jgi:Asp-tRNA(Asn)/Glu-tRNA(Gln) amidotransferase A subunit family amidase
MNFALSGHVKDQDQRMGKMSTVELGFMPATELAAAMRQRELSPVEIVDAFLARIEALNPQLNAFLAVDADRARAAVARIAHSN